MELNQITTKESSEESESEEGERVSWCVCCLLLRVDSPVVIA